MNEEFQLKLQAYLDGELTAVEAREVDNVVAKDADARALLQEMRQTSAALAAFEVEIKLPESREFYWSKIQRTIERTEQPVAVRPVGIPWWRKLLIPAGGFAALLIAVLFTFRPAPTSPQIETYLVDSGAMTYRDQAEKMTVVWLSYPAENDFANHESDDTID